MVDGDESVDSEDREAADEGEEMGDDGAIGEEQDADKE